MSQHGVGSSQVIQCSSYFPYLPPKHSMGPEYLPIYALGWVAAKGDLGNAGQTLEVQRLCFDRLM